ncbi:MAG: shikimate dehydrogenase [Candidatus Woesearchaeota archaeon]
MKKNQTKNIVLIGYRAAGKSSVGRELSSKLSMPIISTDDVVVRQIGSIAEFVNDFGWKSFRDVESDVIKNIKADGSAGCLIDCGGGVVERKDNIEYLRKNSIIFLLDAPPNVIVDRLSSNGSRPSITGTGTKEEVQEVLIRRLPLYEEAADFIINTTITTENKIINRNIEDIAAEIKLLFDMLIEKVSINRYDTADNIKEAKIAAVVAEDNIDDTLNMLKKAEQIADIVEIRIDKIKDVNENDVMNIVKAKTKKMIITNRKNDESGYFQEKKEETEEETEKRRIKLLKTAVEAGADFVDVELSSGTDIVKDIIKLRDEIIKKSKDNENDSIINTKIICSFHDFERLPDDIDNIFEKIKLTDADIIKIACMGKSALDNIRMFNLIEKAKYEQKEMIGIVMGRHGKLSRALSGVLGGFISTFVPVGNEIKNKTAPGQISIEQIKEIQDRLIFITDLNNHKQELNKLLDEINSEKVCLLIGDPVEHSISPIMHNAAFEKLGLDFEYKSLEVKAEKLKIIAKNLSLPRIAGFNITIPHKQKIMDELDEIDDVARKIGAVNTVVNTVVNTIVNIAGLNQNCKQGMLKGFNTDWLGALKAIEENLGNDNLKNKKVVLIGAGGAGRAIAYAMSSVGISGENLIIMSKKKEDADKLAKEFDGKSVDISELIKINDKINKGIKADLLINATPVGMHPNVDESIIGLVAGTSLSSVDVLKNFNTVFDIVYNPLKTKLLREAEKAGCQTIDGLRMLVHQGAASFEMWCGKKPDINLMYDVVKKELLKNK